ncbi:MAG: membrane protein insertase YidC [Geodermatophilaceae bacterium]
MSLDWLYTAISFVLKMWHSLFVKIGLDPDTGVTWALSIFFLVVTVRILLFRFFIKQVKSQRSMQELQPDIALLRKQYGSDRQGMAKAQQELFKERGVNPLSGCLPILLQAPVFLALFHVLRRLRPGAAGLYTWTDQLTDSAAQASLFGAPISSSFNMDPAKEEAILGLGVTYGSIRTVALTLMILMSITTFITQKQIMRKGGPVEGQAAMIQKFMLYVIPVSLFVSGFFFPIGVLLYWFMNNLWTMGQQFYILHKHPPKSRLNLTKPDRPAIDPKLLAPKPGAKPTQPKGRRPAAPAPPPSPVSIEKPKAGSGAPSSGATRKPPPGKRPANNRPKRKKR